MTRQPSKPPAAGTGYDDFLFVLRKFRGLSAAALGTAAVVPFVAFLAQIAPPWPPGVALITGLIELIALITVFQLLRRAAKPTIDRAMLLSLVLLAVGSSIYLLFFALFTYRIPAANTREIAGFVCRADILAAALAECPFVGSEQLSNAGYIAETFWLPWSINVMRFSLAMLWFVSFLCLSTFISAFLVFQTRVAATPLPGKTPARRSARE